MERKYQHGNLGQFPTVAWHEDMICTYLTITSLKTKQSTDAVLHVFKKDTVRAYLITSMLMCFFIHLGMGRLNESQHIHQAVGEFILLVLWSYLILERDVISFSSSLILMSHVIHLCPSPLDESFLYSFKSHRWLKMKSSFHSCFGKKNSVECLITKICPPTHLLNSFFNHASPITVKWPQF